MTTWVEANGVSLRYDIRRGRTRRQLLVLVHEAMGLLESWDEALPYLESRFDTLRYDQRGFGLSQETDTFTVETAVADLAALLDKVAPGESVLLSGCGFGAAIALTFAATHPARAAGLFVASPAGTRSPESDLSKQMLTRADRLEQLGVEGIEPSFYELSYPPVLRANQARFDLFRLRLLGNSPKQLANVLRAAHKLRLLAVLPTIATPTVIVGCTHDLRSPPATMRALVPLMPNAKFVEINSGHFASVQTPDVFAEAAISSFAGFIPQSASATG